MDSKMVEIRRKWKGLRMKMFHNVRIILSHQSYPKKKVSFYDFHYMCTNHRTLAEGGASKKFVFVKKRTCDDISMNFLLYTCMSTPMSLMMAVSTQPAILDNTR